MYKVKLYYLTDNGFEWLGKEVDIDYHNYKQVIKTYFRENEPTAQSLVKKWRGNGENVSMFMDVDNIDTPQDLFFKIYNYVDDLYFYFIIM